MTATIERGQWTLGRSEEVSHPTELQSQGAGSRAGGEEWHTRAAREFRTF